MCLEFFYKPYKFLEKQTKFIISPEIIKFNKFDPKLKVGILASGEGSNFQRLIDLSKNNKLDIELNILITNKPNAGCLKKAIDNNIPKEILVESHFKNKDSFEKKIIDTLNQYDVELVVMAGWMKIVSKRFINAFENKIINIHPSLLPAFKGISPVDDALKNGSLITGCSVHFVVPEVDSGSLIIQGALPVEKIDNKISLTKKIHEIEHKILPIAISEAGKIIRT